MNYAARAMSDLAMLEYEANHLLALGGVTHPPVPENVIALFDPPHAIRIERRPLGLIRAILDQMGDRWLIVLNSRLPRNAQRFSLFHEGYHILQRTLMMPAGDEAYNEWLADGFAARLLMPRQWVMQASLKVADAAQLGRVFGVSERAMQKRLRELGL